MIYEPSPLRQFRPASQNLLLPLLCGGASLAPFFRYSFIDGRGWTRRQIGLLAGMQPLMTLAAASLLERSGRQHRQHRTLLRVALFEALFFALLLFYNAAFGGLAVVALAYRFLWHYHPAGEQLCAGASGRNAPIVTGVSGCERDWVGCGWACGGSAGGLGAGLNYSFYIFALLQLCGLLVTFWITPICRGQSGRRVLVCPAQAGRQSALADLSGCDVCGRHGPEAVIHSFLFLYLADTGERLDPMGLALSSATVSEASGLLLCPADRLLVRREAGRYWRSRWWCW